MNKDAYLQVKVREGIVHKILDKLPQTVIDDIELLPALDKFIMGGDEEMFEEFKDFHFIKSIDEKEKEIEETKQALKDAEAELELYIQESKEIRDKITEYKVKYEEYLDEYLKWMSDLCAKISESEEGNGGDLLNLKRIKDFLNGLSDGAKDYKERAKWLQKRLFVVLDGKLYPITSISVNETDKVILEAKGELGNIYHRPLPPKGWTRLHGYFR